MKRVLFFGIFDSFYARSVILREGFEANGYEVVECRVDPRKYPGWRKYRLLWQKGIAFRTDSFDHILVLFPGHTLVWLAWLLFGNRIVFDAFVSLFDSNVQDRARYSKHSLRAFRDHALDWTSCQLARTVLVDTEAHHRYFIEQLGVREDKLIVVPVGAGDAWFEAGAAPSVSVSTAISIGFYGSYIPLHGIATIVRAAALPGDLPLRFELIGAGQDYARVQELARELGVANIVFTPRVSRRELIEKVRGFDICLGIFGDTEKAARVIPNKVYECAALGKPIITMDTPAIREAFTDQKDIFLCEATPESLAQAIRTLVTDSALRGHIGSGAHARMCERYTAQQITHALLEGLHERESGTMQS